MGLSTTWLMLFVRTSTGVSRSTASIGGTVRSSTPEVELSCSLDFKPGMLLSMGWSTAQVRVRRTSGNADLFESAVVQACKASAS